MSLDNRHRTPLDPALTPRKTTSISHSNNLLHVQASKVSKSPTTRGPLGATLNTSSSKILRMKTRCKEEKQVRAQVYMKLCTQLSTGGGVVILDHRTYKSSDPQPHAFKKNRLALHLVPANTSQRSSGKCIIARLL